MNNVPGYATPTRERRFPAYAVPEPEQPLLAIGTKCQFNSVNQILKFMHFCLKKTSFINKNGFQIENFVVANSTKVMSTPPTSQVCPASCAVCHQHPALCVAFLRHLSPPPLASANVFRVHFFNFVKVFPFLILECQNFDMVWGNVCLKINRYYAR